jgi:hypothetical protein
MALLDTTILITWNGWLTRNLWGNYEPCCALVSVSGAVLKAPRVFYYSGQRDFQADVIRHGNGFLAIWENNNGRGNGAGHNGIFLDANAANTSDTVVYKVKMNLEPAIASFAGGCYALHRQSFMTYGTPKKVIHQMVLRRIVQGPANPWIPF